MAEYPQRLTDDQRLLKCLRANSLLLSPEIARFFDSIVRASEDEHWQSITTQWTTLCKGHNALASCMTLQCERLLSAARARRGLTPIVFFFGETSSSAHGLLHILVGGSIDRVVAICGMDVTFDESTGQLIGDYSAENISRDNLVEIRRELALCPDVDDNQWPDFLAELEAEHAEAERLVHSDSASAVKVECYVTLTQMAAIVNKTKPTLERLRDDRKLPAPAVKGGKGRADEWRWADVRPILEKQYGRQLPERFPSDRFIRR